MTRPALIRNMIDSHISEAAPNKNYSSSKRLYLAGSGSNNTRQAFIYFHLPFPRGVQILSATLSLYNGSNFGSQTQLTVGRVDTKWSANRIAWTGRPGVMGTTVSLTKVTAPINTQWAFDVASMMNTVSGGAKWYGFRVTVDTPGEKWLYSAQADDDYRPTLDITWRDNPEPPSELSPAGGRVVGINKPTLRCDFTDISGDTSMDAIQVQIDAANNFITPAFDSGTVLTDVPELNLATTSYAGLANNAFTYWRVRVRDGAGLWSGWSDPPAYFGRKDKPTLTIQNPTITGTPQVVETNRVRDPSMESGIGAAWGTVSAALYPLTQDTTVVYTGVNSQKLTRASTMNANVGNMRFTPTSVASLAALLCSPGEVMSFSYRVRANIPAQSFAQLVWRDSASAIVGSTTIGPTQDMPAANNWVQVKFENVTAPAGVAGVTFQGQCQLPGNVGATNGSEITWWDAIKCVSGPTINDDYFDGSTAAIPGVAYAWTGVVNQSASTKTVTVMSGLVNEPTPPIIWSMAGQTAYQVIIRKQGEVEIQWTTGKITGTTQSVTVPKRVIRKDGQVYTVVVRAWTSTDNREATPGDPVYQSASTDFIYDYDASVAPVTGLTVSSNADCPTWLDLSFGRATAPDKFTVMRDGEVVDSDIPAADLLVSAGNYKYTDIEWRPRQQHTWKVVAVVNGKSSSPNPTVTDKFSAVTPVLCNENRSRVVILWNPNIEPNLDDEGETFYPVGRSIADAVQIVQSTNGYWGHAQGRLANGVAKWTAMEQRDNLEYYSDHPGQILRLVWINFAMKVVIRNVVIVPVAIHENDAVEFDVEFDWFQVQR